MEEKSILKSDLVDSIKEVRSNGRLNLKALVMGFLLFVMATALGAQFNYTLNTNLTVNITGYTGTNSSVAFPTNMNGLPVARIPSCVANLTAFLRKIDALCLTFMTG